MAQSRAGVCRAAALSFTALVFALGVAPARADDRALKALIDSGQLKVDCLFSAERVGIPANATVAIVRVEAAPGTVEPAHTHPGPEYLYVLDGEGAILIDGREVPARAGHVVPVPAGAHKAIANRTSSDPLRVLAFLVLEPGKPILSVVGR